MRSRFEKLTAAGALAAFVMVFATPAAAYIGPGLGLGVVAAIFGSIAAFFMVIAGLVWYPVKVLLRKRREKKAGAAATTAPAGAPAAEVSDRAAAASSADKTSD